MTKYSSTSAGRMIRKDKNSVEVNDACYAVN